MSNMQSYSGGCHCGAVRFSADADVSAAINVRCLDGVDVGALSPQPFDGASL